MDWNGHRKHKHDKYRHSVYCSARPKDSICLLNKKTLSFVCDEQYIPLMLVLLLYLPSIEVEIYCFTSHCSFVRHISFVSVRSLRLSCRRSNTRRWPKFRPTVYDAEQTLAQYWVIVSCLTPCWMWASVTDGGPLLTQPWIQVIVIVRPKPGPFQ